MNAGATELSHHLRGVLSRHPIAVDCARSASTFAKSVAEVVVFEDSRAFIVASSAPNVLQPRHLKAAEHQLIAKGGGAAIEEGAASFAIRDGSGHTVGALTLHDATDLGDADGFHALCRLITAAVIGAEKELGSQSIETAVLEGLRDAVVVLDAELNVTWVNRAVGSLFGRTPADVIGKSAIDLLHPDDVVVAFDAITRLSEGLEIWRVFVRIERGDGDFERVEVTGVDQSSHPALGGMVLSLRAAGQADELQLAIERAARMNDAILSGLHDGIVATDSFGAITLVNDFARTMFGLDPDAPPSSLNLADFALLDTDGRTLAHDLGLSSEAFGDEPRELCVISTRSELRHVITQRRVVRDAAGEALGSVVAFHDITDARRSAEELRDQALHDQLTGLPNRRQLENLLLELSASSPDTTVAACFIDLDGFKTVNDTHGHRAGDRLIRVAAQRLESELRTNDLLVRQGGDEFVALLTEVSGPEEALAVAERLRVALHRPYTLDDDRFDLTASVGVALAPTTELGDDTLLRQADIALYSAKARGRNRVEVFDADLSVAVELEERQRRLLREALENDRLVMHFQPLIDTLTGRTTGYEALARCRDEHGTLVGPAGFMESITHSGLMWDLDQAAFKLSCQAAAVLAKVTPGSPPIIACNFSAISLVQTGLAAFICETTERYGVENSQICIEITESSAFDAGPKSLATLGELHSKGFLLALDDFGTGYSSLAHLRDLPLTSVKVDRSFIAKLTDRSSERAIAEAIVGLAADLGLGVVAEGVENLEQLTHAQSMGFGTIQGWHYSPALALTEILSDWLGTSSDDANTAAASRLRPGK